MHATSGLRVVLKWMIAGSGPVNVDVITLEKTMEHAISGVRLENRWEVQRWSKRSKTCNLNVKGTVFSFRSETHGFRIHPVIANLSRNGEILHSINEIDGALVNSNGDTAVNTPSRWTLFGQQLNFTDGLSVQIPTLPLFRAQFECDECHGQIHLGKEDYVAGFYNEIEYDNLETMLPRFFQLLWVTTLYGWIAG